MEQVSNKLKESGYTPTMIGTMDDVYYFFINFDIKVGLSVSTSTAGNNKFIPNNTVLVTTVGPGSSIVKKNSIFYIICNSRYNICIYNGSNTLSKKIKLILKL